jgi:hypothetical protein
MSLWNLLGAALRPAARRKGSRRLSRPRLPTRKLRVEALEDRYCLSNFTVFATGLDNPRGLKFDLQGHLYVAEGGQGGTASTVGDPGVTQVPPPIGPYSGGFTAHISRIDAAGNRTVVADNLPSSQTQPMPVPLVSGVADVAFVGDSLYAILAGAGPSHGLAGTSNGVLRVNPNGRVKEIADLSAFQASHPVVNPEPDDFEPDGTWYSMVSVGNTLYAIEPNHGELDSITPSGKISRVIDISASQGHIVPTALAYHDGSFYFGNLGTFGPSHQPENVYRITPGGQIESVATGLSEVLGLTFDAQGQMYVLESSTGGVAPIPQSGDVLRIDTHGNRTVIAAGLMFPTAMTFGPDGKLYVSNFGFGGPPGAGQIVRIEVPDAGAGVQAVLKAGTGASGSLQVPGVAPLQTPSVGLSSDATQAAEPRGASTATVTLPVSDPASSQVVALDALGDADAGWNVL